MEKQYVQFADGSVLGVTKSANGNLEVERDGILIGRMEGVWAAPDEAGEVVT